jgi:hypothetical protein
MALVSQNLKAGIQAQLEPLIQQHTKKAFLDAMKKFKDVSSEQTGNTGKDVFSNANSQAADVFSNLMKKLAEDIAITVSTNVDIFVRTATIIVPPGIAVAVAGSPAAQTGASVAPSPPAIIT